MSWLDRLINIFRPAPRPPVPPVKPGPVVPPTPTTAARDLFAAVNAARAAHGLPALRADARLERTAQAWASECARLGRLDHFGPGGSTPWTRMTAAGVKYTSASENGAMGQRTAAEVVDDWVGERPPGITGHRDNVLNRDFTHCGGGAAAGKDGRIYWFQDYAEE